MNGENAAATSSVPNLPPSNNKCLGTRRLTNLQHENGSFSKGMLATFLAQDDKDPCPYLLVLVTDGSSTCSTRMDPKQAKRVLWNHHVEQPSEETINDETKVHILSSFLLQDQDGMTVTYKYAPNGDGRIQLEIKHLTGGVTRILGSHTLQPTDESNLRFATSLGTVVNDSIAEIHRLQTNQTTLQTNLASWKDTAEKLDRDWQAEKDALLHRFLQLYKKAHLELGESQVKVQQLEQELMQARAHNNNASLTKQKRPPPPALTYAALPDDQDAEQFDSNMVEMLASGKTMDKPTLVGKKRKSSGGSTTGVGAAMRTNPHTGAKEVFDANALFDDPLFFASQTMDPTITNDAAQPMDTSTEDLDGNGKMENKTTNGNNRQDNDEVVDPVMAIASKLPAKKKRASKEHDSPTTAKRAKKNSARDNDKDNTVATTQQVDPIMAAAGKLFAKENSSSNNSGS